MTDQPTPPRHWQPSPAAAPTPEHQRSRFHGARDHAGKRYRLMDAGADPAPWVRLAVRALDPDSPTGVVAGSGSDTRFCARHAPGWVSVNSYGGWRNVVNGDPIERALAEAVLEPLYSAWSAREHFPPHYSDPDDDTCHPLWREASDKEIEGYDRPTD